MGGPRASGPSEEPPSPSQRPAGRPVLELSGDEEVEEDDLQLRVLYEDCQFPNPKACQSCCPSLKYWMPPVPSLNLHVLELDTTESTGHQKPPQGRSYDHHHHHRQQQQQQQQQPQSLTDGGASGQSLTEVLDTVRQMMENEKGQLDKERLALDEQRKLLDAEKGDLEKLR